MTRSKVVYRGRSPAPYRGIDYRIPITDMPPEYSPFMMNFFSENGRITKRPGHSSTGVISGSNSDTMVIPYTDGESIEEVLINAGTTKTDAGEVSTSSRVKPNHDYTILNDTIYIAGTSSVVELDTSGPTYTNKLTYTASASDNNKRKGICSYRERLYIAEGKKLHYSPSVGAVSGAASTFDLTHMINDGEFRAVEEFNFLQGFYPEQYLVLGTSTGEILVYSGSNPSSDDWTIVQKFRVQMPPGNDNIAIEFIKIPNDLLINIKYGYQVYSLKELLVTGGTAPSSGLVESIRPLIQSFAPVTGKKHTGYKTAGYWSTRNKLVIVQFIQAQTVGVLDAWESYTNVEDTGSDFQGNLVFVIDLNDGTTTMHTFHAGNSSIFVYANPSFTLRSEGGVLFMPGKNRATRLFYPDDTFLGSNYFQDYATFNIEAIALFAPLRGNGFRNKSLKNVAMYADLYDVHQDQFFVMSNSDFDTSPGTFSEFKTSFTTRKIRKHTLPISDYGSSVIYGVKEGGENAYPFEILGMDPIFEEGGEI